MPGGFLLVDGVDAVARPYAVVQEGFRASCVVESGVQGSFHLGASGLEDSVHLIIRSAVEGYDLLLPVDHESQGHRLHPSGGKAALYLSPEYGGELEAYQPVENPSRLLGVDQVEVDFAGILYRMLYRVPGYLVEYDAPGMLAVEAEGLGKVPGDGFPFTVFIGCEPDRSGFRSRLLEFRHHFLLVGRNHIFRLESVLHVHAELVVLQIPYVSEAGFHHIAFA